ncbi:hypothetical protein [Hominenteromicrobium sp.]|uniref:hypothetical protein n=1 Tax=Hominenteromicrobium sp. TaxID=3073581 RepID=UPI003A93F873
MKLILPEQITEAQYKAYLADWGAEHIVPSERRKGLRQNAACARVAYRTCRGFAEGAHHLRRRF